jgi:hypothetical protein
MRDEAVIARVAHRRIKEAVHDQDAGSLIELIFNRLATDRHFDDDIHLVGRVGSHGNRIELHESRSSLSVAFLGMRNES